MASRPQAVSTSSHSPCWRAWPYSLGRPAAGRPRTMTPEGPNHAGPGLVPDAGTRVQTGANVRTILGSRPATSGADEHGSPIGGLGEVACSRVQRRSATVNCLALTISRYI